MNEQTKSIFLDLYSMVISDGNIAPEEMETIYRIGRDVFHITEDEINEAVKSAGTSFYIPNTIEKKIEFLYNLSVIAWADGEVKDSEKQLLKKYVLRFGFLEDNADRIVEFLLGEVEAKVPVEKVLTEIV